jgi:hypothetical protein
MTSVSVESPRRFQAGFWIAVSLVFLTQVALVFWLSKSSVSVIRKTPIAPELRITQARSDQILSFEDPTLFVLPHPMDFSGSVWMSVPELKFQSQEWSEPPRWLDVPGAELGQAFVRFVQTNATADFQLPVSVQPELTMPQVIPILPISKPGQMRIEGPLANRQLINLSKLPVQTSADLLTNSIVQVLVNAGGRTVSAVLLPPGSGSVSADQDALRIAENARFKSIETVGPGRTVQSASSGLTFGTMIFEWQTIPPTNAAPTTTQP